MSLNNESSNLPPLPDAIQQQILNAQNQLDLMAADTARYAGLIAQQKTDISNNQSQNAELDARIVSLQANIAALTTDQAAREAKIGAINEAITEAEAELRDAENALKAVQIQQDVISDAMTAREVAVTAAEADVASRSDALAKNEADFDAKVKRVQDAINS